MIKNPNQKLRVFIHRLSRSESGRIGAILNVANKKATVEFHRGRKGARPVLGH